MSVLVIAEIGSAWVFSPDWRQNFNNAIRAIHVAKDCQADVVKFQYCSDPASMATRRHIDDPTTYWRLQWPAEWHAMFAKEAADAGIEYACTVFIPDDVKTIAPYVKRFKVASLEAHGASVIKACGLYPQPIIISTGCMDEKDLLDLYDFVPNEMTLLHCVAAYPSPLVEMNLVVLQEDQAVSLHGLSDHSAHLLTGAVAVGAGAEIIEVHFRLHTTPKDNPDYLHSHNPKRLNLYIMNVRAAELMMGDGIKKIQPSEEPLRQHRVTA